VAYVIDPKSVEGWELHEGIEGKIIADGENMTALMGIWQPKTKFAVHVHPHEQIGVCLQGEAVFTIDGEEYMVRKGNAYHIPPNIPHAERNDGDEPAIFLECFSPVRDDLLRHRFEQEILD
jgi:quercetin dioxygenase-like cupin family protein